MAGLVPAIHALQRREKQVVDARDKRGHDETGSSLRAKRSNPWSNKKESWICFVVPALLAINDAACYRTGIGGRGTEASSGSDSGRAVVCGGGSTCRGA